MTREEAFKKAQEDYKKRQEEEANRGSYTPQEYDEQKLAVVPRGKYGLYRFLGWPLTSRQDSTDAKEVVIVKALDDKDRICYFNIPSRDEDSNFFFYRLWTKVMSYKKDGTAKIYDNEKLHPSIFFRVYKNGQKDNIYEKGMRPSSKIMMNVIDCLDYDWHKEHKHTALICNKASKDGIVYQDSKGIPTMAYDRILDVMETRGDWENYQVVMQTLSNDPYYKVSHALKEKEDLAVKQPELVALIEDRGLTEEELSWERYDLDKLFPVSSYTKWLSRMGLFLQAVDQAFGTKFHEEVLEKSEMEKAKWEAEKKEKETETPEVKTEVKEEPKVETPAPSRRTAPPKETGLNLLQYKDKFPFIERLKAEEIAQIIGVDESKPEFFVYKEGVNVLECSDEKCLFPFSETFTTCPKCGLEYKV